VRVFVSSYYFKFITFFITVVGKPELIAVVPEARRSC